MNEFKDRLAKIINTKGVTQKSFANGIGVKESRISNILSGVGNPAFDLIQKILIKYNDLNPYWLILGELPMFRSGSGEVAATQPEAEGDGGDVRYLKQIVKQQEEMIGALKDHIATLKMKSKPCHESKKNKEEQFPATYVSGEGKSSKNYKN